MLHIQNLTAGYDDFLVLHNLSMKFKDNKVNAIFGTNGCGKSTLLKSIFNQTTIKEGKILLDKKNITNLNTADLIQNKISFVPQGDSLFDDMNVEENIKLGGFLIKDKLLLKKRLHKVYKAFPKLQKRLKQKAKTLSGGEKKSVAIARALMQDADILLLDEPSAGLSPIAMKEIFKIIKLLSKEKTIILVEQNIQLAMTIADYVFIIKNGKIAKGGDAKKIDVGKFIV